MTDTPARLSAIADPAQFENLVALYIDACEPELKGVVQTGINLAGKTVPSSVDGLHLRSFLGVQYVLFFAATTTEKKALRRKWFGGRNKLGDIQKAAKLLKRWQRDLPKLRGRLILATNRLLDESLLHSLAIEADKRGLEIPSPIEATRLSRFLDFTADGQYARFVLLGREPERISLDLLVDIGRQSLDAHERFFPFLSGNQSIARDATHTTMKLLKETRRSLIFLEGASGCGKSTIVRQIGSLVNEGIGAALWIPGHYLEVGASLDGILSRALRVYMPSLPPSSGVDALRLAREAGCPFVILVDDINRDPHPLRAIQSLEALASIAPNVTFVVPVWPRQKQKDSMLSSNTGRSDTVVVASLSKAEQREMSRELPSHVIDILAGDPFLCGLADRNARLDVAEGHEAFLRRLLDSHLGRVFDVAANTFARHTASDYGEAVNIVGDFCALQDQPEPQWMELQEALGSRAECLVALASQRVIGWIDKADQEEIWRWPHERLRDLIVARAMARRLDQSVDWLETGEAMRCLENPALAEVWALTVMLLRQRGSRTRLIRTLFRSQPLGLSKLLRFGSFLLDEGECEELARALRTRLEERAATHEEIGDLGAMMLYDIVQTEHPMVLALLSETTGSHRELIGRARNGDVKAAIKVLGSEDEFWPYVSYRFLEDALRRFAERKMGCIELDWQAAKLEPEKELRGRLLLSGYVQVRVDAADIERVWRGLGEKERRRLYAAVLWFVARCGSEANEATLTEVLSLANELWEEAEDSKESSDRFLIQAVGNALSRWSIRDEMGGVFSRVAMKMPTVAVSVVCSQIDHPDIVEALLRAFKYPPSVWRTSQSVDPLEYGDKRARFPNRPESRERLWQIVVDEDDPEIRRYAFVLWRQACDRKELSRLQAIEPSDVLFNDALTVRTRFRDPSAASELATRLRSEPAKWCGLAPALMNDQDVRSTFFEKFSAAMGSSRWPGPRYVARHLERGDLVELLEREREALLQDRWSWSSVWRNGAPEALAFVREAIQNETDSKELSHVFKSSRSPYPVTRDMLNAIEPVLDKLPQRALEMDLGMLARRSGFRDWAREHIFPRASSEHKARYYPDKEQLRSALVSAAASVQAGEAIWSKSNLLHLVHGAAEIGRELRFVVREWIGKRPKVHRAVVAGFVLERIGTHVDLEWWARLEPEDVRGEEVHAHVSRVLV